MLQSLITEYEKKVRSFVKDFDFNKIDVRQKGRVSFERVVNEIQKKRQEIEVKVTDLLQSERLKMNEGLLLYVKGLRNRKIKKSPAKKAKGTKKVASPKKQKRAIHLSPSV